MVHLLKQFTLLGLVAFATSQELFCNAPLTFFIPNVETNWIGAVEYCNRIGMRLAVVDSMAKHTEILRIAELSHAFNSTRSDLWIGANDLAKEGTFIWHATGLGLNFTQWSETEPNNSEGHEHCVHMWYEPKVFLNWQWNDKDCSFEFKFVCENVPVFEL